MSSRHELYARWRGRVGRFRRRAWRRRAPIATPSPTRRPGGPPDVTRETTHLGPALDSAVFQAQRNLRLGVDPDYDLVAENLDVLHYLLQAPRLIDRPRVDLVQHFLDAGANAVLSPDPHFSMTRYLENYPEKRNTSERSPFLEWLKRGRAAGEIADPEPGIPRFAEVLGLDPGDVVRALTARRADLRERLRTGKLGEMVSRAAEVEPLVAHAHARLTQPQLLPFDQTREIDMAGAIQAAHRAADFRAARVVLVINRPRWGGGPRMEGHLAHALATRTKPEDVVVIYTDDSGHTPPDRFPAGVREIDFAGLSAGLEPQDAQDVLALLLRTFRADAIVNINSATLYRAMDSRGRTLMDSERIFLCLFCNEQSPTGSWTGWSLRYFYRLFDQVAGVITDSHHLADELVEAHRVPEGERRRIHVFRAPVDDALPLMDQPPPSESTRPQVFWAGRWDRQKRIDLLLEIAREMPDVDFNMWGEPVLQGRRHDPPPNVTVHGRYDHITDIPLQRADAWLYTSAWDGVPSLLLEVAMTGIPIVGTLVGGTGEILSPDVAFPVGANEDSSAYVRSLRTVLVDPVEARRMSVELRRRLLVDRSPEQFVGQATGVLLHPDGEEGER